MKISWMYLVDKFYNKSPKVRRLITRIRFREKNIYIKLLGSDIYINTIRENGYMRAYRLCSQSSLLRDEIAVLSNLASLLRNGDSFVDIGANVGIFSVHLSKYKTILSDFRIYAFEAHPDTYLRLKENSLKHKFSAQNIAISDQQKTMKFVDGAVSHVFTTVENSTEYNIVDEVIEVDCFRLDRLDIHGSSLVMKIDVEGQELNVLEGASELFQKNRVKAVYLDGFTRNSEVLSFLVARDFVFFDGRSLERCDGNVFSLLAISKMKLKQL
ncbi:MAG TPA: FkbM family methyltransferase [Nodosilinea sp.]|nr:FkbM family methyltransferase [Nodosilinea sp.]